MTDRKKYVSLSRLSDFLENLKNMFIEQSSIDDSLSDSSINPVQNKVIQKEFDTVSGEIAKRAQVQIITWEADD